MDNKPWDRTTALARDFHKGGGELIIIRGIPGAGKSTLAKQLVTNDPERVHVETDMYFSRYGDYRFDPEMLGRAHRWSLATVEIMLKTRGRVVVSNTFTQYKEMYDYVDYAKRFGHSVEVYTLHTHFGSVHNVPEETMNRMRDRFQSHESILESIKSAH